MKKLIALSLLFAASQVLADARITVSKGDANLCEVIPTQAKRGHHYNKSINPRVISSDLWHSAKNGLDFFHLNKSETQSQTIQLAFVDKYTTFWYYIKQGAKTKGPYFYDFIVPENNGRKFVDIDLKLPCSCFSTDDKPQRCGNQFNRFQDKFGNWWQQTGSNTAKRISNKIDKSSRKAWDATKKGWGNIKAGWKSYQDQ